MYRVSKTVVKQTEHPELFSLFTKYGVLATNLYNAGLFRVRQNFTMQGKEVLHPLEQEVKLEIERTVTEKNLGRPRRSMSYLFLEKLMRVTWNPDFFAGLSMQCAQNVLKQVCGDCELARLIEVGASCFFDPGYCHTANWQFSQNLRKRLRSARSRPTILLFFMLPVSAYLRF